MYINGLFSEGQVLVMNTVSKYQIDMCHGPLFSKIVLFSLPLMASNIMQVLFNAVDMIVIGHYAPHEAMAAVGSCGPLIMMILNIFFGLSVGANVLTARYIGARDRTEVFQTVHTAMATALYGGILLAAFGIMISRPVLEMMQTPAEVLPKASLYMWLYCAGIPFILLYNFGSSILRAGGDTRRPLIYMLISGGVKVGLNFFLVSTCHWDVAGVAVSTLISSLLSSALVIMALSELRDGSRLFLKKIRLYGSNFKEILKIGVPAGIQGSLFSFSNVIIQSTINSFGSKAMAGNAATGSLEGIVYVAFNAYYFSVISFVGQNHGAHKYKRIVKSMFYCQLLAVLTAFVFGWIIFIFGPQLLRIYNPDPGVIQWGMIRLKYLVTTYFLCALMDTISGSLRGLGHSLTPMIVTMLGACFFRIAWVFWVFPHFRTMENLLLSYPVSWFLVFLVNGTILYFVCRKLFDNVAHQPHHIGYGTIRIR